MNSNAFAEDPRHRAHLIPRRRRLLNRGYFDLTPPINPSPADLVPKLRGQNS